MLGHGAGIGVLLAAAFLDAIEVLLAPIALLHGPFRAAGQHCRHLLVVERDRPPGTDPDRNMGIKRVGERLLYSNDVLACQMGEVGAHPARHVESHAACGDDAALISVERGNAADREPISPMCIRHGIRGSHDAG